MLNIDKRNFNKGESVQLRSVKNLDEPLSKKHILIYKRYIIKINVRGLWKIRSDSLLSITSTLHNETRKFSSLSQFKFWGKIF